MINVRSFDGVDLLFDLGDLSGGLLEGALVEFLPAESGFGDCVIEVSIYS